MNQDKPARPHDSWSDAPTQDGSESVQQQDSEHGIGLSRPGDETTWTTLDRILTTALVISPPAELSARLVRIPPPVIARHRLLGERLLELALLLMVVLGAIGLSTVVSGLAMGLLWPGVLDVLQAAPLLLDSPLATYYQSLVSTLLEALATLLLIGLALTRPRRGLSPGQPRPSGQS